MMMMMMMMMMMTMMMMMMMMMMMPCFCWHEDLMDDHSGIVSIDQSWWFLRFFSFL